MAHIYTVSLRFTGPTLDPADIARRLNLASSVELDISHDLVRIKGRQPFWSYGGHDQPGYQPEWHSLEEGLQFLVGRLSTRKADIIKLAAEWQATWWCGHFQSSFDGGPDLSAALMTEVGSHGIPLYIDNYFTEDPPQDLAKVGPC